LAGRDLTRKVHRFGLPLLGIESLEAMTFKGRLAVRL